MGRKEGEIQGPTGQGIGMDAEQRDGAERLGKGDWAGEEWETEEK